MERFVDISLADLGRTVYRYRPVVAAAVAIMILGLALPGPREVGQDLGRFATGAARAVIPSTQTPTTVDSVAVAATPESDPGSSAPFTPTGTGGSISTSSFSSGSSSFSTATESDSRTSSATSDESSSPPPSFTAPPPTTASTAPAKKAATITATSWASRTAGTPVAANGVPAGSLPIGKVVGQDDKMSFIRLSSRPDRIVLKPHAEGQRTPETGVIQACMIKTVGWHGGEAVAFDAAPERDCSVSVTGVRAEDGSWSFDLRPFEGRSGDGIALLPGPGAPLDFQVAFLPQLAS
jgi:hypothetical protein